MSSTQQTLAQMVRSKYPNAYSDMTDVDLEKAVLAKHPEYSDLPRSPMAIPSGESADFWKGSPSIPGQPIQESQTMSPQKMGAGAATAGKTALAGAAAGSLALTGAALAAPGIITEEAATGLLDQFGEPIAREVVRQGPSILGKGFQAAAEWAAAHPMTTKLIIEGAGVAGGLKILGGMKKVVGEFAGR